MSIEKKTHDDMVSKLMGQYLLKGYALLDEYCNTCSSPLMRDRERMQFCVSCTVRAEHVKQEADAKSASEKEPANMSTDGASSASRFETPRLALEAKLQWASKELEKSKSVPECIELCSLMKSCVDTLKTLGELPRDATSK